MKKNKLIAAILFGILAVVQFFGLTYVMSTSLSQMPSMIYVEIAALLVYVFVCVKYFKTVDEAITGGEKRAAAALGVMYFVAVALNSQMFAQLLGLAFAAISEELAMNTSTGIAFLIFRTALLFAALCFVIINEKKAVVIEIENTETVSEITEIPSEAEV